MAHGLRNPFILSLLLGFALPSAAQAPSIDFTSRWATTPMQRTKRAEGTYEGRIFQRFVQVSQQAFPVGSIAYFKIPKSKGLAPDAFNSEKVAEKIRAAMKLPAWHFRKQGVASVYEGAWRKEQRFIRLYLREDSASITYSVAMFRIAYSEYVTIESEIIQRQLAGVLEERVPWLDRFLSLIERSAGIQTAVAAACPPCTSSDPASLAACASCSLGVLSSSLTGIGQIGPGLNNISQQVGNVNTNWANMNAELARSNDLLKETLRPSRAFALAAATGAGVAIGGLAVTAVTQGITYLAETIYEMVTHKKEEAQLLADFQKSLESYEKLRPSVDTLERELDSNLYIAYLSKAAGGREKLLVTFDTLIAQKEAQKKFLEGKIARELGENTMVSDACLQESFTTLAGIKEAILETEKVANALRGIDETRFCDEMRENIATLIKAENELQSARLALLDGEKAWQDAWDKKYQAEIERANRNLEAGSNTQTLDRDLAGAAKNFEAQLEQLKTEDKEAFRTCMHEKAPFWSRIPFLGSLMTGKEREECTRQIAEVSDRRVRALKEAFEKRREGAQQHYEMISQNPVTIRQNPLLNAAALEKYKKWLERVSNEQTLEATTRRLEGLQAKDISIAEFCR